jgi:hypothetical protein
MKVKMVKAVMSWLASKGFPGHQQFCRKELAAFIVVHICAREKLVGEALVSSQTSQTLSLL